tara:strand:- start:12223 stop:13035 length:813 start_codon:yes stop_codon:yes gene_type:complete
MKKHGYLDSNRTYLVSYPRSGANWLRYCLEATTKLPTIGVQPLDPNTLLDKAIEEALNKILGGTLGVDLEGDQSTVLLQHTHRWHAATPHVDIVLIVRNFKECILRDFRGISTNDDVVKKIIRDNSLKILNEHGGTTRPGAPAHSALGTEGWSWGGLLRSYISHRGRKHIVYYEDLKLHPEKTLRELLEFLNIPDAYSKLNEFMVNINHHNNVSIALYNNGVAKSYTDGSQNMSFHSDEFLTKDERIKWDGHMKLHFPTIIPLISRYFEE